MRRLPVIVAGTARLVLPLADRSVAVLIDVLLCGGESSPSQSLAEALSLDPPLFLWTAYHSSENHRQIEPLAASQENNVDYRTADELADWLCENAPAVLNWNDCDNEPSTTGDDVDENAWADRVAEAVEAAEAARLAANEPRRDKAYAAALLSAAARWLPRDFPLAHSHDSRAIQLGDESPDEIRKAARRRGQEARSRWLEPHVAAGVLPRLADRLARLNRLEKHFDETLLAEKLEAMAEFAAGAGHEINNPLAVISGRAQLLLQSETDPERRRALALMNAQAKRVYEMIADMMLFARPPAPGFKKIELTAIIDRIIRDLRPAAAEQSIALTRSGHSGPLEIEADPDQIHVALSALLRNSLEAIGRDGHVEIDVATDGVNAVVRVADDGPGISAEIRRHIFDPFYSARQAGRGLGLGLSKCRRIVVANHRGSIDVESLPGRTTVFTITLPLGQE